MLDGSVNAWLNDTVEAFEIGIRLGRQMGIVKLAASLDLSKIKTPVLVVYSPDDRIVDPQATVRLFSAIGTSRKQLQAFQAFQDPSQHVLAGDILSPRSTTAVAEMIHQFVKTGK